eukprot:CAMPEP_0175164984 /NCGR_PEP_ID=MMETSP0087-20121206/26773_1 /TAXON_ID=136419 /ORGANISM="Unknown Unknown, Strain D1" /LENGTH=77 /DNA_ID=CAMNT_0016454189 /DNA_START=591 /DNA_END=821 /DNA_ORIENTATION=-
MVLQKWQELMVDVVAGRKEVQGRENGAETGWLATGKGRQLETAEVKPLEMPMVMQNGIGVAKGSQNENEDVKEATEA